MHTYSKPRHIWRAIYPALIYLAVSFVVIFICLVAYGVYIGFREAAGGIALIDTDRLVAEILRFTGDYAMWIQFAACVVSLAVFIPLWRATRRTHTRYNTARLAPITAVLISGAGIGLCLTLTVFFELTDLVRFFPSYELVSDLISGGSLPAQILTVCIAAPVAEELCFRGIIGNRLGAWLPDWAVVLCSGFLFGLVHLNLLQGLYAFLLGVALALVYIRTRTIWAAVVGHIAFNSASILLNAVLIATGAEPSAWAVLLPAVVLSAACIVPLARRPYAAG